MRFFPIFISLMSFLVAQGAPQASLAGNWMGTLESGPGATLRIALHLTRSPDGILTGTLDSVDQGAMGLPLGAVTLNGSAVSIELKAPAALLTGTLSSDGSEIAGEWRQGGGSLPLTMRRADTVPVLDRPQEPKGPLPYRAEDVQFPSKQAGVQLAGTLTLPQSGGPFPAVLLITGSGAQNRDEELLGHKPFLVIADHLTRAGIAVLRVDDRGTAKSTGVFAGSTTADFVEDAAGSLAYLESRKEIDPKQIGLLGHSEGAVIAPMLAVRDTGVAFVVMMAGTGVSGRDVLKAQAAAVMRAAGASDAAIAANQALQEELFGLAGNDMSPLVRDARVREIEAELLAKLPDDQRAAMEPTIKAQVATGSSAWMRYFVNLNPALTLQKLRTPVLVLNGALDQQVLASQNLPAIAQALEQAGNPDYEIVKFPHLNHLFQTAVTGGPGEYAQIPETVAPLALDVMTTWILRHVK